MQCKTCWAIFSTKKLYEIEPCRESLSVVLNCMFNFLKIQAHIGWNLLNVTCTLNHQLFFNPKICLQILSGMFPIAQVQEPYTAVGYLAQRVNLIPLLKIQHPLHGSKPGEGKLEEWSAWDICEGALLLRVCVSAQFLRRFLQSIWFLRVTNSSSRQPPVCVC